MHRISCISVWCRYICFHIVKLWTIVLVREGRYLKIDFFYVICMHYLKSCTKADVFPNIYNNTNGKRWFFLVETCTDRKSIHKHSASFVVFVYRLHAHTIQRVDQYIQYTPNSLKNYIPTKSMNFNNFRNIYGPKHLMTKMKK